MAAETKIEWADSTLNFWIGCTKVSAGCDHCYAERDWDHRKGRVTWGPHGDRSPTKTHPIARQWQNYAERNAGVDPMLGRTRRVFVNSLADSFDNHRSIDASGARQLMWDTIRACPLVTFMMVTKRPENMRRFLPPDWGNGWPNVWLLVTAENQETLDRRVPILLDTPAVIRGVSYEPAIGAIDLKPREFSEQCIRCGEGPRAAHDHPDGYRNRGLDWVIAGGESGPNARPPHPAWFRQVRDQCAVAGVAFLFKQWGEWGVHALGPRSPKVWMAVDGEQRPGDTPTAEQIDREDDFERRRWSLMVRLGKANTGRKLDGRTYDEFPV